MDRGNYRGRRAQGRPPHRGEDTGFQFPQHHDGWIGSESIPIDDRRNRRDSRPKELNSYDEVTSKWSTTRYSPSFQNQNSASAERIKRYAEEPELNGRRENKNYMNNRRHKTTNPLDLQYNHKNICREYFGTISESHTSVRNTNREDKRSENEKETMNIERDRNENYSDIDRGRRISDIDRYERYTYRDSDKNTERGRDDRHNEIDRNDIYGKRDRNDPYSERLRDESYSERGRNGEHSERERDERYSERDRNDVYSERDINDRYNQRDGDIYAERDRGNGYSKNDDQYSKEGRNVWENERDRKDLYSGGDRGRNLEYSDNKRVREERYEERGRRERYRYRENRYSKTLTEHRESHTQEKDKDNCRANRPRYRDGEGTNREKGSHIKRKRRRFQIDNSSPYGMTLNGRQSTSGSEIGTHINSDLEDGEYRSPDRDIPEQKLMHYETYDQTDSEENRPVSRKSYSSCIKRTNSGSERSSNVNTRQLSPVSSASFSSHDCEHKDLYEDTLFIPNMNVSNDNEGFQTECMSARNDKFRIDCLPRSRINRSDENEAIVTLQPEILAKKRRMIVEIKDVLQTLEDAVHLDIAAETMKILMEEGTGLSARNVYDKLQERVDSLDNWFEIEDVIEEKFTMEYTASSNDDNLGRKVICQPKNCSIKICKFSDTRSNANCKCDALHICKFFMLSECQDMFCAFGHDLRTEHNVRILKKHFLHRLTIKQLKAFIRQKQTRNETTIPLVCNFYNSVRGYKHENMTEDTECSYIHVCRYYTRNNCKFGSGCKRSHDLLSGQSLKILKLYGLEQNPSEEILTLLNKKVDPSDHINKEQREECKDSMLQDKNKEMSREIDKLAREDSIEESVDYIPVETEPQQVRVRYFTQQYVSTDAYAGQHEVGNGTENKLTWGQGDASVQSKNNQTRKRNGMFSESKSSNKTNILELSDNNGSDKTATINDVFESITPDKEIIDDDTIDVNTQWKKLRQECSPMIFEDSEEVRKAASPSYEYTVQHDKYENGSMIVERNVDGSPKEIVQELLQIMLETIANEVVLQREDSSGSSYGIPTDLRENNASPALKTTNGAPLVSEEA